MLRLFAFYKNCYAPVGQPDKRGDILSQEFGFDEQHARQRVYNNIDGCPGLFYPLAPFEMRAYMGHAIAVEYPLHDPEGIAQRLGLTPAPR